MAQRYFSITSKAIKKYDPNHLFLGARLHGQYLDDDATDPTLAVNYRAANQGIASPAYEPYGALLDEMRALNENVYPLTQYFAAQK